VRAGLAATCAAENTQRPATETHRLTNAKMAATILGEPATGEAGRRGEGLFEPPHSP